MPSTPVTSAAVVVLALAGAAGGCGGGGHRAGGPAPAAGTGPPAAVVRAGGSGVTMVGHGGCWTDAAAGVAACGDPPPPRCAALPPVDVPADGGVRVELGLDAERIEAVAWRDGRALPLGAGRGRVLHLRVPAGRTALVVRASVPQGDPAWAACLVVRPPNG